MVTQHAGSGNPLDTDINVARETQGITDTDIEDTHNFNNVETVHFEDLKHNNPAKLTALTRDIDDLHQ